MWMLLNVYVYVCVCACVKTERNMGSGMGSEGLELSPPASSALGLQGVEAALAGPGITGEIGRSKEIVWS